MQIADLPASHFYVGSKVQLHKYAKMRTINVKCVLRTFQHIFEGLDLLCGGFVAVVPSLVGRKHMIMRYDFHIYIVEDEEFIGICAEC